MILAITASQFLPVEAKSIYLGGERIVLDDVRLDKFSCSELGLVCTVCKEPVRRRKGEINIPHFAHFATIDPKKREECERRRSVHGGGIFPPLPWPDSKGERLELFQKHFLTIIKKSIPALNINAISSKKKTDTIYSSIQLKALTLLKREQGAFTRYIRAASKEATELEVKIACEALGYITVVSSKAIFMLIAEHLILYSKDFSYSIYDSRFPKELCFKISSLLASVDWTESFTNLSGVRPPQIQIQKKRKEKVKANVSTVNFPVELHEKLDTDSGLFLYLVKEKIFLGSLDSLLRGERQLIGFVKINELLLHRTASKEDAEVIRGISPWIGIYRRHHRFDLFKESLENQFLPYLQRAIKNGPKSSGKAISVKTHGGEIYLSKKIEDFMGTGRAKIMYGEKVVALVKINPLAEEKYAEKYLLENFFIHSREYRVTERSYPMLNIAVLRLIQKQYKKLHSK